MDFVWYTFVPGQGAARFDLRSNRGDIGDTTTPTTTAVSSKGNDGTDVG